MKGDMMKLEQYIDHTLLSPVRTYALINNFIDESKQFDFASLCVYSSDLVVPGIQLSQTPKCTVISFPHGGLSSLLKLQQSLLVSHQGVDEVDVVLNYNNVINNSVSKVNEELRNLKLIKKLSSIKVVKVIVETCYLTKEQIEYITQTLCNSENIDYIKTSTGFGLRGASEEDIVTMKNVIDKEGSDLKIKASGGIKTLADAMKYINLGCSRIGTSNAFAIMQEYMRL